MAHSSYETRSSMAEIASVRARPILDSRGNPTVEVDVRLADGAFGRAGVPSGASTGSRAALERRDGDAKNCGGRGVTKAVSQVRDVIGPALRGMEPNEQPVIAARLCALDGT